MNERHSTMEKPHPRWPLLLVTGFVVLIHVAWALVGDTIVANGGLADGDSFTRLVRVERLIDTGAWFDNTLPRANAPFGTTVHRTRPFRCRPDRPGRAPDAGAGR